MQSIYSKYSEYKIIHWHRSDLNLEKKASKTPFLAKYDCFFSDLCVRFEPLLGWKYAYACQE